MVANFISKLFKDTTVTGLDSTRALASPETPALAQNEIIKKLRSSAKKRRPSRKRAEEPDTYFDPIILFKFLSKMGKGTKLGMNQLRNKLALLLLLDGGLRLNELCKIFVENITLWDNKLKLKYLGQRKRRKGVGLT